MTFDLVGKKTERSLLLSVCLFLKEQQKKESTHMERPCRYCTQLLNYRVPTAKMALRTSIILLILVSSSSLESQLTAPASPRIGAPLGKADDVATKKKKVRQQCKRAPTQLVDKIDSMHIDRHALLASFLLGRFFRKVPWLGKCTTNSDNSVREYSRKYLYASYSSSARVILFGREDM